MCGMVGWLTGRAGRLAVCVVCGVWCGVCVCGVVWCVCVWGGHRCCEGVLGCEGGVLVCVVWCGVCV